MVKPTGQFPGMKSLVFLTTDLAIGLKIWSINKINVYTIYLGKATTFDSINLIKQNEVTRIDNYWSQRIKKQNCYGTHDAQ
jgi:purine-cytosine permease-like protein